MDGTITHLASTELFANVILRLLLVACMAAGVSVIHCLFLGSLEYVAWHLFFAVIPKLIHGLGIRLSRQTVCVMILSD